MQKVIIDGYNVVHADEKMKRLIKSDLQEARRELIRALGGYLERKRMQITVVFDGRGGLTDVEVEIPGRLQVLFSSAGQSADELIIEILQLSSNPREYLVVTSDMADIGRSARALGADVIASKEFLSRIVSIPTRNKGKTRNSTVEDVDYWLNIFENSDKNTGED